MDTYDPKKIERKWQARWEKEQTFRTDEDSSKEKLYVLDMFPYPSGSGLHVGHVEGYAATDIYSRYQRTKGYNVLHPMGWDAFGLPAENYAIKTGVPPHTTTADAIGTFRSQMRSLGLSYDWSREIGTYLPEYYKWTQWFFLFLFKNGLAEKRLAKVNWCPKDQTVLANEQTVSESGEKGVCVRCGTKIIQKDLEQWFFKITEFSDALIDDLDTVDWPESTKINQRNWIGRSEGAEIEFALSAGDIKVKVFTTRPDTLFGATYMVLAPEHPLVATLIKEQRLENTDEVAAYVAAAANKTDLDRQTEEKEKTGVELKGITAVNPANKKEIPLFVADYVLGGYGTGAIMAVPAHDERDFAFARTRRLPIIEVIANTRRWDDPVMGGMRLADQLPFIGGGTLINSENFNGLTNEEAKKKITEFVSGKLTKTYKLRDWLISRQRYWGAPIPVVYDPQGKAHPVPEEHLPWLLPTDVEFRPTGTSPLGLSKELQERTERIFGKGWRPEIDTMDTFVCSSWYYFRFGDPRNEHTFASKESIAKWQPVDLYMGGAEHTVLHLMYARFFTKALHKFGQIDFIEPFTKLRHQGMILAEDSTKMSKSKGNVINPDDMVALYGADTIRMYEMFMGPLEAMKPWSTKSIVGVRRFLERTWSLAEKVADVPLEPETETLVHQTIRKVGEDIEALKMNTAVSALMILVNHLHSLEKVPALTYTTLLQLLAPFAPHMSEELWEKLGHTESIQVAAWPLFDAAKTLAPTAHIAVQINGKVRVTIELPTNATEAEALGVARADEVVAKWLAQGSEVKAVYVPGRILNFVINVAHNGSPIAGSEKS